MVAFFTAVVSISNWNENEDRISRILISYFDMKLNVLHTNIRNWECSVCNKECKVSMIMMMIIKDSKLLAMLNEDHNSNELITQFRPEPETRRPFEMVFV